MRQSTILLEITWSTKFFTDRNFSWFLEVTEVKISLRDGYFWRGEDVVPTLQFRRHTSTEIMDNNIGMGANNYGIPTADNSSPTIVSSDL